MSGADADEDLAAGEITLAVDDDGVLVLGDQPAVDRFVERVRRAGSTLHGAGVTTQSLADLGSAAAALEALKVSSGTYFRMSPDSLPRYQQSGAIPGSPGYFKGVQRAVNGQWGGNLDFQQVGFAAEQAVSLQLTMATVALRAAINEVHECVKRVEDKVDLLALATKAEQTGRVLGHHKTLVRRVEALEQTGTLPAVDWQSVAGLEPDLNAAVEELRAYAVGRVRLLKPDAAVSDRAKQVRAAAVEEHLGEVLQMLVVAEDSLYRWQRLRIERARTTEPENLEHIVRSAREHLAADLKADAELVRDLREALVEYGKPHPLEAPRFRSRKKIAEALPDLRGQVDQFVEARRLQVETWPAIEQPTLRDARHEIGRLTVEAGQAARHGGAEVIQLTRAGARRAGDAVSRRIRRPGA